MRKGSYAGPRCVSRHYRPSTARSTMQFSHFKDQLHGIWAFPVTPFDDELAVDTDALRATLAFLLEARPAGLVAAGGSGEHFSLDLDEYRTVVQNVVRAAQGALPVIAGVGGGYGAGREQARVAREAGADGLMALPPSYPRAVDDGLVAYYATLAEASGLPLVVYTRDWAAYGPDLVARLAELPAVVGLKEGQGDLRAFARLRARVGDRLAWLGGVGPSVGPAGGDWAGCGGGAPAGRVAFSATATRRRSPTWAIRWSPRRRAGPEMLTAATGRERASSTAAATHRTPSTFSPSSTAYPLTRAASSCSRSAFRLVVVRLVWRRRS